jgi:PAS domain S-box-containing protein
MTGKKVPPIKPSDDTAAESAQSPGSHPELEALFIALSDAVVMADTERRITMVNPAAVTLFGYRLDDIAGQTTEILYADAEQFRDQGRRVYNLDADSRATRVVEVEYRRADGSTFVGETIGGKVYNESCEVSGYVGIIRDISERKQFETALAANEKKYKQLVELLQEGVWAIDKDAVTTYVNPAMAAMLGYRPEEMLGRHLFTFMNERGVEITTRNLERRRRGITEQHDFELLNKHGERVYVMMETGPILDKNGEYAGSIAGVLNITERKHTEDALREHRERLEELVAERTRDLEVAHAELVNAERLAALGELTATIGHELRNPLGTIRSTAYVLEKQCGTDNEVVQRALERMERNIRRCDRIIGDLLGFARSTALQCESTALDSWLATLLEEYSYPDFVQVHHVLGANVSVEVDPERLRQAVINVLDNAVHALEGESSAKDLTVESRVMPERVEIRVSDTGCGIRDDVLPNIFQPLYSTKSFGVGLGLPTVKRIMEQHKGGVEVSTVLNQGTTMILWLPRESVKTSPGDA